MALVSVSDTKTFLGIPSSDTSQDNLLELLITSISSAVEAGIGPIEKEAGRKQKITSCDITKQYGMRCVLMDTIEVISVEKINGTTYTGTLGTNYMIEKPNNRKLCFDKTLFDYIDDTDNYIEIEYTSGYDDIPNDLQYAVFQLISHAYNKDKGQNVKSYKVGDVSVSLGGDSEQIERDISAINSILALYKTYDI